MRLDQLEAPIRYIKKLFSTPAVVLAYHRVSNISFDPLQLSVSPENFDKHINILKKSYNVISIYEFEELFLKLKKFPKYTVLITFDDGYADNLYEALPILESYKLPATFFITCRWIGSNEIPWWDKLTILFFSCDSFPKFIELNNFKYCTQSFDERLSTYNQIMKFLRISPSQTIQFYLDQILKQINSYHIELEKDYKMLNQEELRLFASNPHVTIGNHTFNHIALGTLSEDEQSEEISSANQFLEKYTGRPINYISYPFGSRKIFGKRFYNKHTFNVCEKNHIKLGFANYYGQVYPKTFRFSLPRVLVRNINATEFDLFMKRAFTY